MAAHQALSRGGLAHPSPRRGSHPRRASMAATGRAAACPEGAAAEPRSFFPATGALRPPGPSSASAPERPGTRKQRFCRGRGQRAGELLRAPGLGRAAAPCGVRVAAEPPLAPGPGSPAVLEPVPRPQRYHRARAPHSPLPGSTRCAGTVPPDYHLVWSRCSGCNMMLSKLVFTRDKAAIRGLCLFSQ